jgi:hypothetical protein
MMGKPHKHADLIKAWADGADIQQRYDAVKEWQPIDQFPSWAENFEYRIKPNTVKYRLYLWENNMEEFSVEALNSTEDYAPEASVGFVRWLGDWQEVEV